MNRKNISGNKEGIINGYISDDNHNSNGLSGGLTCRGRRAPGTKLKWTAALVTAMLLAGSAQTVFAGDTVYVNCDVLRCRSSEEIKDGNIVTNFYYGDKLERVGSDGEWTAILVNGQKRYVASAYLSTSQPAKKAAAQNNNTSGQSGTTNSGASDSTVAGTEIGLSASYKYADFSKINSGKAILYKSTAASRKNKTVCVNAGHGTKGGGSVKTLCHPDGTAKVTGGTTSAGATTAVAVSSGMTFADGTAESKVTLAMAKILKDRLLAQGYDVLMIRETEDVQLDNIARTVIANNNADCHIALHWDSTSSNKGCFFMSVPNNASYRAMEPVASYWQQHNKLGESLITGLKGAGNKIFSGGSMEMDLTQTSFSTIPSIDIELGDKASNHSTETLNQLADGLTAGINAFFGL